MILALACVCIAAVLRRVDAELVFLCSVHSGLCVDVPDNARQAFKLRMWDCELSGPQALDQVWYISNGQFISMNGQLCIDVTGASATANDLELEVYYCGNADEKSLTVKDGQSERVVVLYDCATSNASNAQARAAGQLWEPIPAIKTGLGGFIQGGNRPSCFSSQYVDARSGLCLVCPPGEFSANGQSCTACPMHQYWNKFSRQCENCSASCARQGEFSKSATGFPAFAWPQVLSVLTG